MDMRAMLIKPFPEIDNIHTIAIPFEEFSDLITANVYLLGNGPVTLIDTGPKLQGSFELIKSKLKGLGLDFNDVERIIITHGHVDHYGQAVTIRQASQNSVKCFIHAEDKWRVSSDNFQSDGWSKELEKFAVLVGMPAEIVEKIKKRFSVFRILSDPLDEVTPLEEGEEFIGEGFHLKVIHTPGHSPGNMCLYESRNKILFSGDHIIKHITPNPLLELRRDQLKDPKYQSLKEYSKSLDKLNGLDVRYVFPGHGEYIEDLEGIISSYKIHHRERMDLILKALKKEMRPIFELIDDVFPHVPEKDMFLALSEIWVHLEILINEGRAELTDSGPPVLYRAI